MKTTEYNNDTVREKVRDRYAQIAREESSCGCSTACCQPEIEGNQAQLTAASRAHQVGYSPRETSSVPQGANLGLGCGNPHAVAALRPGQTVLDLGSGAGFDAFLASPVVGPSGRVIGVDMTPQMISKARQNQAGGGYSNVEFRLGEIENLPVADATVDVIISNCVINLSPDKARVFQEAFRVLKPGGKLAISDVVALRPLPENLREEWELYTSCLAGAALLDELKSLIKRAGFGEITVVQNSKSHETLSGWLPGRNAQEYVASATIQAVKPGIKR